MIDFLHPNSFMNAPSYTNSIKVLYVSRNISSRVRSVEPGVTKTDWFGVPSKFILCCEYFGRAKISDGLISGHFCCLKLKL